MAVTASGWFTNNFIKMLNAEAQTGTGGLNLTLATWRMVLYDNTITPDFDASVTNARYGAGAFASGEVSGTGWAAGGELLSGLASGGTSLAPTLTVSPAGSVMWDMTDVSKASTTLTNARCCTIYADPITAPNADPQIILVNFGASYSTVNGTFGVTWASTGVSALDLTP
jgi:hypothetical protein